MHMPFAQIKLSPESCFSHVADYAAETVWVATSTIFFRRPRRPISDRVAKTK